MIAAFGATIAASALLTVLPAALLQWEKVDAQGLVEASAALLAVIGIGYWLNRRSGAVVERHSGDVRAISRDYCASGVGTFVEGSYGAFKTQTQYACWTLTLDFPNWRAPEQANAGERQMTRLRVPFVIGELCRFAVYRPSVVDKAGARFGWQDVILGDEAFDRAFVIKGTSEAPVSKTLASERVRAVLLKYPDALLEVIDSPGLLGPGVPHNVDILSLTLEGGVADVDELITLHELIKELMECLCASGIAVRETPYAWL